MGGVPEREEFHRDASPAGYFLGVARLAGAFRAVRLAVPVEALALAPAAFFNVSWAAPAAAMLLAVPAAACAAASFIAPAAICWNCWVSAPHHCNGSTMPAVP